MAYNFAKLTTDVRAAMQAGTDAAATVPDNGTCNLDGVILRVPRIQERLVTEALAQAGVHTKKGDWGYHGIGYMLNPGVGQANKRVKACEAIADHLRDTGHVVRRYYQMD